MYGDQQWVQSVKPVVVLAYGLLGHIYPVHSGELGAHGQRHNAPPRLLGRDPLGGTYLVPGQLQHDALQQGQEWRPAALQ